MALRRRGDRAESTVLRVLADREAAERGEKRPDMVAALRFSGLGFDCNRVTELRRRALLGQGEAHR